MEKIIWPGLLKKTIHFSRIFHRSDRQN